MPRRYDASRRREQARRTRDRILDAAVELHARGVTAYEPLAAAAGVSLPTVKKHFPNREALFRGCTGHFLAAFEPPELDRIAGLADPAARIADLAGEMCRANEAMHGLVFHNAPLAPESPALTAALDGYRALVDRAADVAVAGRGLGAGGAGLRGRARERARARVRALLDPLTHRAFRVSAGLELAAVRRELTALLGAAVGITVPEQEPTT